jgi:hypothetical protein
MTAWVRKLSVVHFLAFWGFRIGLPRHFVRKVGLLSQDASRPPTFGTNDERQGFLGILSLPAILNQVAGIKMVRGALQTRTTISFGAGMKGCLTEFDWTYSLFMQPLSPSQGDLAVQVELSGD